MAGDLAHGHQIGTFQVAGEMRSETKAGVQLRCKVDDLAIVTKCGVRERIGLIVRVVERCGVGVHDWLVKIQGAGVVARDIESGEVRRCAYALMHDWNLTPITGMDLPRQTCLGEAEQAEREDEEA
ncbi:hypothetical protein WT98_30445 [Burkholderia territorii]|nr:hypothetical protein WT98_30445 [Burkholderia territorii]